MEGRPRAIYLSIFSSTSAIANRGFRIWCCKLCCNSGKQIFHWVVHTAWIILGSLSRIARFKIKSSFCITFNWACRNKIQFVILWKQCFNEPNPKAPSELGQHTDWSVNTIQFFFSFIVCAFLLVATSWKHNLWSAQITDPWIKRSCSCLLTWFLYCQKRQTLKL